MNQVSPPKSVVATYFIPGLRVSRLPDTLDAAAQPGTPLPDTLLADVIQAEVTRVCSGASQYSITLNNYITTKTSTPPTNASIVAGIMAPPSLTSGTPPKWPPYKYNDFSLIAFGNRLRIDMQDWRDPSAERKLSNNADWVKSWIPMVSGPVTDMRFEFSSSAGARVTVSGEDDLSQLKDHRTTRKEFPKVPERQIVREVLKLAEYPLKTIAEPQVQWPPFADDAGQGITESIGDGQSYLDFLQKLAGRIDCEIFIEFSDLTKAGSALRFHFEPSRCRVTPDKSSGDIFVLDRDRNLIEFNPSIKVVDQPSMAQVKGRSRDRNDPSMVSGTAIPSLLKDELHAVTSGGSSQALVAGPLVRAHFFKNRTDNPMVESNATNLDQQRAKTYAEAQFRKKAREFMTIDGVTIGLPRLRPGNFVQITGMRPPFDGFYYVTKTTHTYGADGMRTKFSARRPGMVLPPYQES
jgi:hypothetical protein